MNQQYTSDELVHLVGWSRSDAHDANYKTLCQILASLTVETYRHEKGEGANSHEVRRTGFLKDETRIRANVTCFADIPCGSLKTHVGKYGHFGLAFKRKFLVFRGARPVMYVPRFEDDLQGAFGGRDLLAEIERAHDSLLDSQDGSDSIKNARGTFEHHFLAFMKPFCSWLPLDHPDNYYMEREWRKFGNLRFSLADVASLYVANGFEHTAATAFPALAGRIHIL